MRPMQDLLPTLFESLTWPCLLFPICSQCCITPLLDGPPGRARRNLGCPRGVRGCQAVSKFDPRSASKIWTLIPRLRGPTLHAETHFGLKTTLRPEVDRVLTAYYDLLARPMLSQEEAGRLQLLRSRLDLELPMDASPPRTPPTTFDSFLVSQGPCRAAFTNSTKGILGFARNIETSGSST